jgi:AmmeMemoRadiSam system protein B
MIKQTFFHGSFYSEKQEDIKKQIKYFNDILTNNLKEDFINQFTSSKRAIIAPHAGYVYSGFSANIAYNIISKEKAKRIIVLAPSHKISYDGVSILSGYDKYSTPLGDIDIDITYGDILKTKFNLVFDDRIHQEHSSEVQMPFIKHYFNLPVIELIYSKINEEELSKLVEYILLDDDNILVVSSDLSHFYNINDARIKDNHCLKAISKVDISLYKDCEACGGVGIKALLIASKKLSLVSDILDYRTSADYSKDESSVVGYTSAIFSKQ